MILTGDGPERKKIEKKIEESKMNNIILFGSTDKVNLVMNVSDVFVLPSKYESFGAVLLEAMASGLPCVAFRPDGKKFVTASDEIIKDGETGFLVPPKDSKSLAEKIIILLKDKNLREQMGNAGRERLKDFSIEKMVQETENIYDNLLKKYER